MFYSLTTTYSDTFEELVPCVFAPRIVFIPENRIQLYKRAKQALVVPDIGNRCGAIYRRHLKTAPAGDNFSDEKTQVVTCTGFGEDVYNS